jgi:hypothetical protein
MEMVPHQAIGKRVAHRRKIITIQLHEIPVIPFFQEDVFPIIAPVVNVIITPRFQGDGCVHEGTFPCSETWQV